MEVTEDKVIAKEMIDRKDNTPKKIIRRIDMIIKKVLECFIADKDKKKCSIKIINKYKDVKRLQILG